MYCLLRVHVICTVLEGACRVFIGCIVSVLNIECACRERVECTVH